MTLTPTCDILVTCSRVPEKLGTRAHTSLKKIGRKDHGVNIALYCVFIESSEVVINKHS